MKWYDLTRLYSSSGQTDSPVAVSPLWQRNDFIAVVWALRVRLQQHSVRSIALYCDDAAIFACVLLACVYADVDVYLPSDLAQESQQWAEQYVDIWIANQSVEYTKKPIWFDFDHVCDDRLPEKEELSAPESQTTLYLQTSGSGSTARTVCKTIGQMQAEVEVLLPFVSALPNIDAVVGSVSTQHLYGLTFRIALSLLAGWPIFRKQQQYPESLLEKSSDYQHTIWISSPTLLNALAEHHIETPHLNAPSLIISSGGALPWKTAEKLSQSIGLPWEIYGSTETGVMAHRKGRERWQFFEHVRYGANEEGALWVQSDWTQGIEQTADGIHLYPQGFELLGRIDRIIKLADKRVSLAQMENRFLLHEWLSDVYCGIHPQYQRIVAWVALNEQGISTLREQGRQFVIDALKSHIGHWYERTAQPRFWRFEVCLPRNSQSKITFSDFQAACRQRPVAPSWVKHDIDHQESYFTAHVPLDLHYFGGHFATFPLVPGAVQLQWIMELGRWAFPHLPKRVLQIENLKFRQFLRPNDEVVVRLTWLPEKQKIQFSVHSGTVVCSSGRVLFLREGSAL